MKNKNLERLVKQKAEKILYILSGLDLADTEEFNKYYSLLGRCFEAYNHIEKEKLKTIYTGKYKIQIGD